MKVLLVLSHFFFGLHANASSLEYIGKCSWDRAFDFRYSAGHALAEFYLDDNIVYVHNYIDEKGGDFRDTPTTPSIDLLQVAGKKGLKLYSWDSGRSRVNFTQAPLRQVRFSTDSVNSLTANENIYAPCYFITE